MTLPDNCAFPNPSSDAVGLTKREWLAGIICAGMCSNTILTEGFFKTESNADKVMEAFSYSSVIQADALIAALNKNKE